MTFIINAILILITVGAISYLTYLGLRLWQLAKLTDYIGTEEWFSYTNGDGQWVSDIIELMKKKSPFDYEFDKWLEELKKK